MASEPGKTVHHTQLRTQKSGPNMHLLAKIVSAWADLPPQIQQAIATLVEGYATKQNEPEVER